MKAGLSTKNAPSPWVVLPHFLYGALALFVASILLFFAAGELSQFYLSPKVISLIHVIVLGFITMIIFGALYQLIPVVMEVKLYSETLAYITFFLFGLGVIMLSFDFWSFLFTTKVHTIIAGSLIILAVLIFVFNTLMSASKTKLNTIENKFIITSVIWLLLTVVMGLLIIINFSHPIFTTSHVQLMKIHVHLGIVGWFSMLTIGVASKLLPMFFIAHRLNTKLLKFAFYFINLGLVMLLFDLFFTHDLYVMTLFSVIIITGFLLFIKYNYDAYKKRLRKKLDVGMKLSVLAFIFLAISIVFGFFSTLTINFIRPYQTRVETIYIVSFIIGFLVSLILGQMYKTLPFIVWLQRYQDKVGKYKIPLPQDMYSEKIAKWHYYSFAISMILLFGGILLTNELTIQVSSLFFVITSLLYGYNTIIITFHKQKLEELKPAVKPGN